MSEFLQLFLKNDPIVRNASIDQESEKETKFCLSFCQPLNFNPLSPSIHIQILQSDLHTFPLRIS